MKSWEILRTAGKSFENFLKKILRMFLEIIKLFGKIIKRMFSEKGEF